MSRKTKRECRKADTSTGSVSNKRGFLTESGSSPRWLKPLPVVLNYKRISLYRRKVNEGRRLRTNLPIRITPNNS